ncbi:TPR repeat containing protein [Beggiatoa sp. PS]|nr:TPR repeat containing protein [Beggiatoa sp. PS]
MSKKNDGKLPIKSSTQTVSISQAVQLANQYFKAGQWQRAQTLCQQILQVESNNSVALYLLGMIEAQFEHDNAAIALIQKAIQINNTVPVYYGNLGNLFKKQGQFAEAIKCYQHVIAIEAHSAKAHNNIGNVLEAQNQVVDALASFQCAIALEPNWAEAHTNYSLTLLKNGQLLPGWQEFEWRLKNKEISTPQFKKPKWDGTALAGRRLLVHWEQGLGDSIQFVRYLPLIKNGTVIFVCQPALENLFKGLLGIDILRVNPKLEQEPKIAYDVWVPLLSLPKLFATTLNNIPVAVPYLYPDADKVEKWRTRFETNRFNVGIIWAGSPTHKNDRNRSCPLFHFAALSKLPNVTLFSLQKGKAVTQPVPDDMTLISLTEELIDFSDTAAAIAGLDLVISVDTSVAHLAGAMGKPVWVLLPVNSDWRWLLERNDSPWYPTMRLFRQSVFGDWESVFHQVAEELFLEMQCDLEK